MTESSIKRIIRKVIASIADECNEELVEAKTMFGDKIKEHFVSPVIQKVYKDMFPYVCAVSAVLVITLVLCLMLMIMIITRGVLMK